jgi:hypothetical protein
MYEYEHITEDYGDEDEGLMGALRKIGEKKGIGMIHGPSVIQQSKTPLTDVRHSDVRHSDVRHSQGSGGTPGYLRAEIPQEVADLGEDIIEVRLRAKSAQANHEEMRRQYQVDLNEEKHLEDLEDKGLVEHMRVARRRLAEGDAERATLPSRVTLLRDDMATRRALSALMTKLKEQQMTLQCACDEVHAQATNVGRLAGAEQPHGYPPVGEELPSMAMVGCLTHLSSKMMSAVCDLNGISAALGEFERDLTLARRGYEAVASGLRQRGEHFEDVFDATSLLSATPLLANHSSKNASAGKG